MSFPRRCARSSTRFAPAVAGVIVIRPRAPGVRQEPPLPVSVELAAGADAEGLAERIRARLRDKLLVTTEIELVAGGQPAAQRIQVQARRESLRRSAMQKLQTQGLHHITLVGADRQTSIDFWEGVLGMPFIFEQPNLDNADESHIYFDPGDGRLITVFTNEDRKPVQRRTPTDTGCVHHIAFNVSRAVFMQAVERLERARDRTPACATG